MTQEKKAKAYDKALEKIKYVMEHGVSPTLNKEDLEDIFPELKESKDEVTRKDIINFVKSRIAGFPECERFVAWLEKQGEQKDKIFDFKSNDWYVSKVDGKIHNMTYNPNNKVEHPKWTEEDDNHWMMCLECVEECATQEREDFSKTIDWLKSIKKMKEQ